MLKNEAQEKIINTIDGQLIVVACPGSGKTTTLVRRINHMVKTGIDPRSIIMMTFSKAAAKEMKERYTKQFPETHRGLISVPSTHSVLQSLPRFSGMKEDAP